MHIGDIGGVEIIAMNECVVHNDRAATPPRMPARAAPTAPTTAEIGSHRYADAEAKEAAADERDTRMRIIPVRITEVDRRSPDVGGVVLRHINHFRTGGLNFDDRLASIVGVDYPLLRGRG